MKKIDLITNDLLELKQSETAEINGGKTLPIPFGVALYLYGKEKGWW